MAPSRRRPGAGRAVRRRASGPRRRAPHHGRRRGARAWLWGARLARISRAGRAGYGHPGRRRRRRAVGAPLGPPRVSTRAIWVLGMHRSGTSLTAGALRLLGADLGPTDGFLPADERDNPKGYWEQKAVIDLNVELLARLSGSSVAPPAFPTGWAARPELDDLRARAREILAGFDASGCWARKDPRLRLTLPFWLPLVDESAAIVCLRSPRDVAASLRARDPDGPLGTREWTAVWHEYTHGALHHAEPLPHELVFYDDWF